MGIFVFKKKKQKKKPSFAGILLSKPCHKN